jgi:hypothetical protein
VKWQHVVYGGRAPEETPSVAQKSTGKSANGIVAHKETKRANSTATAQLRPPVSRSQTQGREPRRKAVDTGVREHYLDDENWVELARRAGVTLPRRGTACTPARMEKWMKKLGFNTTWYRNWSGFRNLQEHIDANPTWSLRAWVGMLLEEWEYEGSEERAALPFDDKASVEIM